MVKRYLAASIILVLTLGIGCQKSQPSAEVVKAFPINSLDGVLTRTDVTLDTVVSSDSNGAVKIFATQPTTVRLFEVRDVTLENARLLYRARVKTENVTGQAYLEMWCVFPGLGEYSSRSLQSPLSGTVDWTTQETPFFLLKGQKPEVIKLNVVINGQGTVWVDEIALLKGPLK